jgi:PAS domain S-box-containing protein
MSLSERSGSEPRAGSVESPLRFTAPFAVVLVALLALVVLPFVAEWRMRGRHQEAGAAIEQALQLTSVMRTALARQIAASRGFALTGDRALLDELVAARTHHQVAVDRLALATRPLGHAMLALVDSVETASIAWGRRHDLLLLDGAERQRYIDDIREQQRLLDVLLASMERLDNALADAGIDRQTRMRRAEREAAFLAFLLSIIAITAAAAVGLAARRQRRLVRDLAAARDVAERRGLELTSTLAARELVESALRDSELRLRRAVEFAPFPLMIHAEDGEVLRLSRAWTEVSGYTDAEVPTIDAWVRLAHAGAPEIGNALRAMYEIDTGTAMGEYVVHTRYGEHRIWDFRCAPLGRLHDGRRIIISAAADVTARTQVEQVLRRSNERLEFLFHATSRLLAGDAPEDMIGGVFTVLRRMLDLDHFIYFRVDPALDPPVLRLAAFDGLDPAVLEGLDTLAMDSTTVCGSAAAGHRRIVVTDVRRRSDPMTAAIRRIGVRAYACFPLLSRDRLLGTLSFGTLLHDRFDDDEIVLLNIVADQLAVAMERAESYRGERAARRAAEQANVAKDQFLAVMSHELRTPLTAITGYSELLHDSVPDPLSDRQRVFVSRIRQSAWNLAQVIDEVLTFARTQAGKEQVHHEVADLADIVRDAVALVEPEAARKGVAMATSLPIDGSVVEIDVGKFRRILVNLIGNAVKFTDEGRVDVALAIENGRIRIDVTDTGTGIAPSMIERIFEPFVQADPSNTRTRGGTGLGLTITRDLARLLGGTVTVESVPGRGSRFSVDLPARSPSRTHG